MCPFGGSDPQVNILGPNCYRWKGFLQRWYGMFAWMHLMRDKRTVDNGQEQVLCP